jgi:hypothetical protein
MRVAHYGRCTKGAFPLHNLGKYHGIYVDSEF